MKFKNFLPARLSRFLNLRRKPIDAFVKREAAAIPAGSLVVDLGCGECNYKDDFKHCRYIGIDMGVGNDGWNYATVDVVADLSQVPVRGGVADVVLCTETLEHLERPWVFAPEVARLLKPGGKLLLTTPQMARVHQLPYDFFRYTSFGLESLFTRPGLTVKSIEPEGGYFILLGDTMKHFHGHVFRTKWLRYGLFPLYWLSSIFCQSVIPLFCMALDPLDTKRRFTMGYTCVFEKPGV